MEITNEQFDKLVDWLAKDEPTDAEVTEHLAQAGIDMQPAFERMRTIVDRARRKAMEQLREELAATKEAANQYEEQLATACDHLNTWARSRNVEQCKNPWGGNQLRDCIERVWISVNQEAARILEFADKMAEKK